MKSGLVSLIWQEREFLLLNIEDVGPETNTKDLNW